MIFMNNENSPDDTIFSYRIYPSPPSRLFLHVTVKKEGRVIKNLFSGEEVLYTADENLTERISAIIEENKDVLSEIPDTLRLEGVFMRDGYRENLRIGEYSFSGHSFLSHSVEYVEDLCNAKNEKLLILLNIFNRIKNTINETVNDDEFWVPCRISLVENTGN